MLFSLITIGVVSLITIGVEWIKLITIAKVEWIKFIVFSDCLKVES